MFDGKYVMWGGEHSLFTRKLQAMLTGRTPSKHDASQAGSQASPARPGTAP